MIKHRVELTEDERIEAQKAIENGERRCAICGTWGFWKVINWYDDAICDICKF